jgi:hypothetical protein
LAFISCIFRLAFLYDSERVTQSSRGTHRNHGGMRCIKFSYDTDQRLSTSAGQAA